MQLSFRGELIYWRGPSPWHFVEVPARESEELGAAPGLSYGWGCIPVTATIGSTEFTTSLFPREGRYVVPVKAQVRTREGLELGDVVEVALRVTR